MATREGVTRRFEDRINDGLTQRARLRAALAVLMATCGGLAVLYLFFALIGTLSFRHAATATVIALALAAVWTVGAWHRARTGATRVQRLDRERRGF
ncbi:MAG TPA: hypothetical protein VF032_18780 [Thermoleophilaceae bacterium]